MEAPEIKVTIPTALIREYQQIQEGQRQIKAIQTEEWAKASSIYYKTALLTRYVQFQAKAATTLFPTQYALLQQALQAVRLRLMNGSENVRARLYTVLKELQGEAKALERLAEYAVQNAAANVDSVTYESE